MFLTPEDTRAISAVYLVMAGHPLIVSECSKSAEKCPESDGISTIDLSSMCLPRYIEGVIMTNVPNIKVEPPGPEAQKVVSKDTEYIVKATKSAPLVFKKAEGARTSTATRTSTSTQASEC